MATKSAEQLWCAKCDKHVPAPDAESFVGKAKEEIPELSCPDCQRTHLERRPGGDGIPGDVTTEVRCHCCGENFWAGVFAFGKKIACPHCRAAWKLPASHGFADPPATEVRDWVVRPNDGTPPLLLADQEAIVDAVKSNRIYPDDPCQVHRNAPLEKIADLCKSHEVSGLYNPAPDVGMAVGAFVGILGVLAYLAAVAYYDVTTNDWLTTRCFVVGLLTWVATPTIVGLIPAYFLSLAMGVNILGAFITLPLILLAAAVGGAIFFFSTGALAGLPTWAIAEVVWWFSKPQWADPSRPRLPPTSEMIAAANRLQQAWQDESESESDDHEDAGEPGRSAPAEQHRIAPDEPTPVSGAESASAQEPEGAESDTTVEANLLKQLRDLHQNGLISDEEYSQQRRKVLAES
jgi:hypothetical protein